MGVDLSVKHTSSGLPRRRRQVAAVCYRIRKRGIEFLLVQTRGGRWIFPKGGVEPGLTPAQSAALEAFEEAGVHGRMEALPFARYFRRRLDTPASKKGTGPSAARAAQPDLAVTTHLCEVSRLEPPQETNRNPTWYAAEKAKQRLLQDRTPEFGAELVRVVDRALSRIARLHSAARHIPDRVRADELQKARFEAHEDGRLHDDVRQAVLARYFLRPTSANIATNHEIRRPTLRLSAGTGSPSETVHNITAIDSARRAHRTNPDGRPSSKPKPGRLASGRTKQSPD